MSAASQLEGDTGVSVDGDVLTGTSGKATLLLRKAGNKPADSLAKWESAIRSHTSGHSYTGDL